MTGPESESGGILILKLLFYIGVVGAGLFFLLQACWIMNMGG
jgi:hypothetical protein